MDTPCSSVPLPLKSCVRILCFFLSLPHRLFDRATVAAGADFRSDKLWDMYISWEKENKDDRAVTALYDRLLKIPTQLYSQHFDRLVRKGHSNVDKSSVQ